jgi:predicted nucleic-acid-binding protein
VIAVDTNVVVRLLVDDDPRQGARAKSLFETDAIWLPKTVVLETEWVLRSLYGLAPKQIADALLALIALPNVQCEDEGSVVEALHWSVKGIDLADALHLGSAKGAERFVTFDNRLAKRARAAGVGMAVGAP